MVSSWDDQDEKTHIFDSERADGSPSGAERWYISPDGKTKEVLAAAEIIERARSGALSDSTLVWRDGLTDWTRLDAVPELMQAVLAFRSSSSATILREPSAPESTSSVQALSRGAGPLPPVPGAPALGPSHRPPTGGPLPPLPPPPSLPPLVSGGHRSALHSEPQEANTIAIVAPLSKAREPQPTLSSVASQAGQLVANSSRDALGRMSVWVNKLTASVDRDVTLPKVGVVRGRLLAQIAAGAVLLTVVLLLVIGRDSEPSQNPATTSGSSQPQGDGMNLDDDDTHLARAEHEDAVSLADLEPVAGGQGKTARSSTARGGVSVTSKVSKKGNEFDVLAAKEALSAAAAKAAACKQGPKGEGSVRVKLAPSGKVVSATLTTPEFQGTPAGSCVLQVFRQATVPAFVGEDTTVFKKFVIN
jgi:hypothetical protein